MTVHSASFVFLYYSKTALFSDLHVDVFCHPVFSLLAIIDSLFVTKLGFMCKHELDSSR